MSPNLLWVQVQRSNFIKFINEECSIWRKVFDLWIFLNMESIEIQNYSYTLL